MKFKANNSNKKQKGSVAVEYMVLTVFIGLALITGAQALGSALNDGMSNVGSQIASQIQVGGGEPTP